MTLIFDPVGMCTPQSSSTLLRVARIGSTKKGNEEACLRASVLGRLGTVASRLGLVGRYSEGCRSCVACSLFFLVRAIIHAPWLVPLTYFERLPDRQYENHTTRLPCHRRQTLKTFPDYERP